MRGGRPLSGRGRVEYRIAPMLLGQGTFYLSVSLCKHQLPKDREAILHYVEKASQFSVRPRVATPVRFLYEPEITFCEPERDA